MVIREDWVEKKLIDVCSIHDNLRKPINNKERNKRIEGKIKAELYPYYGATGQVGYIDDYLTEGEYLLIGEDAAPFFDYTKNVAYLINGKTWVNNHAHILSSFFSNNFLLHYLNQFDFHGYVSGSTRLKLTQTSLRKIPIIVPPLPEQRAIVTKIEQLFSELDKGIDSFKSAQQKLDIYRQAVLKKAFEGELTKTWREQQNDLPTADELLQQIKQQRQQHYQQQLADWEKAVKDWEMGGKEGRKPRKPPKLIQYPPISTDELSVLPRLANSWSYMRLSKIAIIGSGMSVSKSRKLINPFEVAYLRVANVQRGVLNLDEIKTMPIEKGSLQNMKLKKWDVLFNEGGDRDKLGRGWVWESQISPCITQNHVFRASLYFPSGVRARFVSYWGNTFGKDYFERTGKQTTNLASINKSVLSMFPVPFPSFQEQTQIVQEIESRLSVCDKLSATLKQQLKKAEALRQSILKKAFEGRLLSDAEIQTCQQQADWEPAEQLLARIKAESAKNPTAKPRKKQT